MRLATGLFWSNRHHQIEAILYGKKIAVLSGRVAGDIQTRGAFREHVARILLSRGNPMEFVVRFSTSPIKRCPEWANK